jgi:hypothetical protein
MQTSEIYLVIHDFNKSGSACMIFAKDKDFEFHMLYGRCLGIAKPPLQVVMLGGRNALDVYSEYKPYTFYTNEQDMLDICISGNAPGTPWKELLGKNYCPQD